MTERLYTNRDHEIVELVPDVYGANIISMSEEALEEILDRVRLEELEEAVYDQRRNSTGN
jgi:hypothetical protein